MNEMSLEQIIMYYDYMIRELTGDDKDKEEKSKPDKKKFYELYGDKIETPEKGGK